MTTATFRRKITAQSVLAFILIIFGMALVMLAMFMPPRGEIHPSVITVFGMLLVAAGAFLGIDLNFQFKSFLHNLQAEGHPRKPEYTSDTSETSATSATPRPDSELWP